MKSARLLQWLVFFVRPQTSPRMYFLVQTLFDLRVRVPALARNFFDHLRKRTRLKGPLSFLSALCDFSFFCLQRVPLSIFFDILQQTRFSTRSEGPSFYDFKNDFKDIAPTLNVPVLFFNNMRKVLTL